MSSLQTYTFDGQLNVRTIIDDKGEPLFVAKDVAVALGYKNTVAAISQHCTKGITVQSFQKQALVAGGASDTTPIEIKDLQPQTTLIREPDVYALIFGSKLATAEKFKTWVFEEVLPSIRKTGSYGQTQNPTPIMSNNLLSTIANELTSMRIKIDDLEKKVKPHTIKFGDYAEKKVSNAYDIDEVVKMLHPELPQFTHYALKEKLYNFLRDYRFIDRNGTFPTTRGVKENIVGIEVVPICYKLDEVVGKSIKSVIYEEHLNDLCYTFIKFINAESESKINLLNKVADDHDKEVFIDTIEVPYLVTLN
jgi:prophage antirepressor-like protein